MLIGLTGRKQSGKSTAAAHLCDTYDFTEYAFAQPLKRVCQAIFQFTDPQVFGDQSSKETVDPRWGVSPRVCMQRIGTELFRKHFHELFPEIECQDTLWIELFRRQYDPQKHTVVSDVRFDDEANAIRSLGGVLVRIQRRPSLTETAEDTHISEHGLLPQTGDYVIQNNGDKNTLYRDINHIVSFLF